MPNLQHLEAAARRKLGVSEDWKGYQFEVVGNDYIVVGSVPVGTYSRGPRKGRPKWEGEGTKVLVMGAEVQKEIDRYVRETGNCPDCFGTKETFASWNIQTGTKMKTCEECKGSGKASVPA